MNKIYKICALCIVFVMISILCTTALAYRIDGYFNDNDQYTILATIIDAGDTTYTISCGHILASPENAVLPEKIVLNKFRYSYDSTQADNYNTPHLGDNIIISFKKTGSSYQIQNGIYMVNTVTYSSAFLFIPKELTKKEDILKLAALSYYIRSNGECVEYDFRQDAVFSKEGFEIVPSQYLKVIETDNITGRQEEIEKPKLIFADENKWLIGVFIILFGMVAGLIALVIINKRLFR